MIGSKYIEINWKNWVQGMTTSNWTEDGGFSIGPGVSAGGTTSVNPMITAGILHFPASPTDKSTNLSGDIIMSATDSVIVAAKSRVFVTNTGKFYTSTSLGTLTLVDTDATRAYVFSKSDMESWFGYVYGTSSTYIFEWQVSPGIVNQTFQDLTATYANANLVPHPVLVYENNLYYGNGNLLLRQTTTGGAATTILTLNESQVIQALGIDPGTGKMLISTFDSINLSATKYGNPKVLYYDGFSNKPVRSVPVDDMVTMFKVLGGTVFVAYGNNFGYWNGTGPQFLRQLDVGLTASQLLYKHHVTNVDHILYVVEKNKILAFGEVMQGQGRSWWYALINSPAGTPADITCLTNLGSGLLSYSYNAAQQFTVDTTDASTIDTANALLFSRKYDFPRNVTFNNFVIDYKDEIPINTAIATVYLFTDTTSAPLIGTVQTNQAGITTWQLPFPTTQTRTIQMRYIPTVNRGIERITLFYNDKD